MNYKHTLFFKNQYVHKNTDDAEFCKSKFTLK